MQKKSLCPNSKTRVEQYIYLGKWCHISNQLRLLALSIKYIKDFSAYIVCESQDKLSTLLRMFARHMGLLIWQSTTASNTRFLFFLPCRHSRKQLKLIN